MATLIQDAIAPRMLTSYSPVPRGQFVRHGQCPDAQLGVGHQLRAASVHTHLLKHGPQEKLFHRLFPNISGTAITESMASKC